MKTMIFPLTVALIAASIAGCSGLRNPGTEQEQASKEARVSSAQKSPPVRIVAAGPEEVQPGSVVEVTLKILRNEPNTAPMTLNVTLPAGAELVEGTATETITDATAAEISRVFKIRVDSAPQKDLSFELLQGTGRLVARAEAFYRFGRPEPRLPVQQNTKPLKLNNTMTLTPVEAGKQQ